MSDANADAAGRAEAAGGRVLVVDADYDTLASVARSLRERGHHVVLAADGRAGLTRAVEVAADVVLVDRDVSVVDIRTFLEVLRDNPRTSGAHVFLMGTGEPARLGTIDARAEPIVKPFNAEEVASRVDEVLRVRHGPVREPELQGDLTQVALFDLLQVLGVNRRTGSLELRGATATGEVWIREGRIVDAVWPGAVGEKALHRLLRLSIGQFVFVPGLLAERERIDASTDQLLMDAARRADEISLIEARLPSVGALVSAARGVAPTAPLAAEIVGHLDEPRAIDELLDLCGARDLEVLSMVADMIAAGGLLVFDPRGQTAHVSDEDGAIALRAAATRLRRPGLEGPVRIGVLSGAAEDVSRFARALGNVQEFVTATRAPTAAGEGALGQLGVVRLEGTDVEVFALPLDPSLRPLWAPLLAPARVALHLGDPAEDPRVEELLTNLAIRLVRAPAGWERPAGAAAAVRAALAQAAPRSPVPR